MAISRYVDVDTDTDVDIDVNIDIDVDIKPGFRTEIHASGRGGKTDGHLVGDTSKVKKKIFLIKKVEANIKILQNLKTLHSDGVVYSYFMFFYLSVHL